MDLAVDEASNNIVASAFIGQFAVFGADGGIGVVPELDVLFQFLL
ncbi:uncharacterized protein METZ01_LOCUS167521 [marine metagenome]|uniref:Uncharacterized protein n=1 Tax=marine metagenome TaxID=408172 RepID=A0A382BNC8_9ZZZZ